jgi:hypothetical protein
MPADVAVQLHRDGIFNYSEKTIKEWTDNVVIKGRHYNRNRIQLLAAC